MQKKQVAFMLLLFVSFLACKKGYDGERKTLPPPETYMAIDTIYRTGENRLTTLVEANWWGYSDGGLIIGYEVSTDNMQTWQFSKIQDSSFLLKIPPGQDSADVVIFVRAIDHLYQKDPSPASTLFPIKNSKPEVKFIFSQPIAGIPSQNPTQVFPLLKYTILGSDPDGEEDIYQYELYLNDTLNSPFILPANTQSFILESTTPKADLGPCKVYVNGNNNPLSSQINGLRHNQFNTVYVRVLDKALAKSGYTATPSIYVKKVNADILLVNAYNSSKIAVQNFYANNLKAIGITLFDTLQATEVVNVNFTQLQPDFQSQSKTFAFFKKIVWFGDDANFSFSFGQRTTGEFFQAGGRFFMAVAINSSFDPLSNFLDWTPIKNLVNPPSGSLFRVNINETVKPVFANWPYLKSTSIIASARPFETPLNTPSVGYDSLYYGGIIESKSGFPPLPWTGQSAVLAKRYSLPAQKTNFVISSLPLERFNGNINTDTLFQKIFKEELGF